VTHKFALVAFAGFLCLSVCPKALAFGFAEVEKKAEALAASPFQPLDRNIPPDAASMSYAVYQTIRFNKEKAVWRKDKVPFQLEMFYRAFLFPERIRIHLIDAQGQASEVDFSSDLFTLDSPDMAKLPETPAGYGFAGLKVYHKFPAPRGWQEAIIFQGASYFRIPTQAFGLSNRGLAINTASDKAPEEFPAFTDFWVTKPKGDSLTIYALLDGPTVTGAYEFIVHPGAFTSVDVKASLFFRQTPDRVGYAPLTSMFFYGENNYRKFPDYRPEVHDSDGLLIEEADGNRIWRPLQTVKNHLVDAFGSAQPPRGFGLLQRDRAYANAVDNEAFYHLRPSAWVEPVGEGWTDGSVILWQIPTVDEYHDNIVAYWKPNQTPKAGEKRTIQYRVMSIDGEPADLPRDGQVIATYLMPSYGKMDRFLIMVDFAWGDKPPAMLKAGKLPTLQIEARGAEVLSQYVKPNVDGKSWRAHAVIQFPSETMNNLLRARLVTPEGWESEEWVYTFVPQG